MIILSILLLIIMTTIIMITMIMIMMTILITPMRMVIIIFPCYGNNKCLFQRTTARNSNKKGEINEENIVQMFQMFAF